MFKETFIRLTIGDDQAGKRIGPGGRCFLVLHGLFSLSIALSSVFVNVYFWQLEAGLDQIAIFNLVQFISLPCSFLIAGYISNVYKDRVVSLQIGIIVHIIFFAAILLLREQALSFLLPLGVLGGIGAGFFYLAVNVLLYDLTDQVSVDRLNGLNGFVVGLASMFAPFVAGIIISALPGLIGYRVVFVITLFLLLVCTWLSRTFWERALVHRYQLAIPLTDPNFRGVLVAALFFGIRSGALVFLIDLLVFAHSTEFVLGFFSFLTAGSSLVAAYVGGRVVSRHNRGKSIRFALFLFISASLILIGRVSFVALFAFGLLDSIATPFFDIPFQGRTFWAIDQTKNTQKRVEYLVLREIALNLGRVVSILMLLLVTSHDLGTESVRVFMALVAPTVLVFGWAIQR